MKIFIILCDLGFLDDSLSIPPKQASSGMSDLKFYSWVAWGFCRQQNQKEYFLQLQNNSIKFNIYIHIKPSSKLGIGRNIHQIKGIHENN